MKNKNERCKNMRKQYTAQFFRHNHITFAAAVLAAFLTSGLDLWIAWVLQQMIDRISGVTDALKLSVLGWLVVSIIVLIAAFDALKYVVRPRFMEKAMRQYKDYAFAKLTQKSIAAFSRENTSDYISAFSNDASVIESGYLENLFDIITDSVLLVGALVMMLAYSPVMTVTACAFFALPIGVSYLTGNRLEKAERNISDQNGAFTAALKDSLSGFSVMKSFQAEKMIAALFSKHNADAEHAKCEKRKLVTVINGMAEVAGVTAQLGTFLVGGRLAESGMAITPGVLIVFLNLTAFVIGPIRELPELFASRQAVKGLIDKLAEVLEEHVREEGIAAAKHLEKEIVLKKVSFGYEADCEVLHDITYSFKAGKSYAVVGASGSGKSTLLNLLMAGNAEYAGQICYDGRELKEISSEALYELVSFIQQNVFIFNASIWDNITMFHAFPKEEVESAIKQAGLTELIAERGEAYLCGENGSGLSGGEKQRIAIARSLLKKSQVLLVDEATSALDTITAYQVSDAILGLSHMTRIVVTHRLDEAFLKRYDGILALKNGKLEESGSFEELMQKKAYFYSLFTVSQ